MTVSIIEDEKPLCALSPLVDHALQINRLLNSMQRLESPHRLCWAVTQAEYDALERELQSNTRESLPLRDLHILGIRVVVVPNLGEMVLR